MGALSKRDQSVYSYFFRRNERSRLLWSRRIEKSVFRFYSMLYHRGYSLCSFSHSWEIHTIQMHKIFGTKSKLFVLLHFLITMIISAIKEVNDDIHWRRTKVETTGATQDYETLISRLFETFLYFETKNKWCHGTSGTT